MEKSRRGRHPKKHNITLTTSDTQYSNTPIIAHLPISMSEILNEKNDGILLKQDNSEVKILKKKIEDLTAKIAQYERFNDTIYKPSTIICTNNSKCWWDKCSFNTPPLEMPESYYNEIFKCSGIFCSWECKMAYNIEINDENVSKRTSLIHYMYKKTYNVNKIIKPAPSWKILTDFGGSITIQDFRLNLTTADFDYNYIKPPMISRISYIEKIPLKKEIDILKTDDLVLKRTKPLKSSKYSLESIMGLTKIVNS